MHYIITPSDLDCDLDETSRGDAAFAITHYIITPHAYYGTSISNVKKNKTQRCSEGCSWPTVGQVKHAHAHHEYTYKCTPNMCDI